MRDAWRTRLVSACCDEGWKLTIMHTSAFRSDKHPATNATYVPRAVSLGQHAVHPLRHHLARDRVEKQGPEGMVPPGAGGRRQLEGLAKVRAVVVPLVQHWRRRLCCLQCGG